MANGLVVLAEARVLAPGRAHSALDTSNVKCIRYAHELSCVALFILREEAYLDNTVQLSYPSRDAWCGLMKDYPQFQYWNDTPDLETIYNHDNRFIRSQREDDLDLYIEVLGEMVRTSLFFFTLTVPGGFPSMCGI